MKFMIQYVSQIFKKLFLPATHTSELLANLIAICSWLLSSISGIALASQDQPVNLPGINIPLDTKYQFALLVGSLLTYIHFLQIFWRNHYVKKGKSGSFTRFVLYELPLLRYPLLLVPFILFWVLGYKIGQSDSQLRSSLEGIPSLVTTVILGNFVYRKYLSLSDEGSEDSWKENEEKWIERIERKFSKQETVSTDDFYDELDLRPFHDDFQINWALKTYFKKFESRGNIRISAAKWKIYSTNGDEYRIRSQTLSK